MGKAERTLKRLLKEGKDVDMDDEGPPPLSPRTKLLNEQREALTGLTDMLSHEAFNAFLRRGGKVDALETLERTKKSAIGLMKALPPFYFDRTLAIVWEEQLREVHEQKEPYRVIASLVQQLCEAYTTKGKWVDEIFEESPVLLAAFPELKARCDSPLASREIQLECARLIKSEIDLCCDRIAVKRSPPLQLGYCLQSLCKSLLFSTIEAKVCETPAQLIAQIPMVCHN